jgi:hypothetical protein
MTGVGAAERTIESVVRSINLGRVEKSGLSSRSCGASTWVGLKGSNGKLLLREQDVLYVYDIKADESGDREEG